MTARPPSLVLFSFAVALAVSSSGCSASANPDPDPQVVRTSEQTPRRSITIPNVGPDPVELHAPHFEGGAWTSFRIGNEDPLIVPAHGALELEVVVDPRTLAAKDRSGHTRGHEPGSTTLVFSRGEDIVRLPVHFGEHRSRWLWIPQLILAAAWLGVALLLFRRQQRPTTLAAFVGLVVACCALPLADGVCPGRLSSPVGPLERAQCSEGLGGFAATAAPPNFGLALWLCGLLIAATSTGAKRRPHATAAVVVAGLTLLAVSFGTGAFDFHSLVAAQARWVRFGSLSVPGWGIVRHPLAFAGFIAAMSTLSRRSVKTEIIELFLFRAAWGVVGAACFLGGWDLLGFRLPVHALDVGMQASTIAAKAIFVVMSTRAISSWSRRHRDDAVLAGAGMLAMLDLIGHALFFAG